MNRSDLQKISSIRSHEARNLLRSGQYNGAYYLAGYAVECALKACIAKLTQRYEFPDRDRVNKSHSHKLSDLMALGLDTQLNSDMQSNPKLTANWAFVRNWSEQARYSFWNRAEAESMIDAITKRNDGVIPWIRRHW